MPKYKVLHSAITEYIVVVEAPDEATALGSDSYRAKSHPSDHYWNDSEIIEEEPDEEPDIILE